MAMTADRQDLGGLEAIARNGLLDRRAFLRGGAAVAGTVMGYTFVRPAAAAPLADDPWSLGPGGLSRPYQQRSRFEEKIVRWVQRRVDLNEYKREQAAPGLKVTSRAFGLGRHMPIAQKYVD